MTGTKEELRLAIGKSMNVSTSYSYEIENDSEPTPAPGDISESISIKQGWKKIREKSMKFELRGKSG
jgi:hypothetical protein